MARQRWRVRLAAAAEQDVLDIVLWTADYFGVEQARRYRAMILAALRDLGDGPDATGTRDRVELDRKLRSLHVARRSRRGRHVILFTAVDGARIEVVRILRDSMDLARHLPEGRDEE